MIKVKLVAVSIFLASLVSQASAAVIDFDTLALGNGSSVSTYSENGFTVTATNFLAGQIFGNPVPSLFSNGGITWLDAGFNTRSIIYCGYCKRDGDLDTPGVSRAFQTKLAFAGTQRGRDYRNYAGGDRNCFILYTLMV